VANANREDSRDLLAELIEDELVGTLGIVQAVYNYKVGNPQGQSPIVCVISSGSARPPGAFGEQDAVFYLEVQIWVLYSDPDAIPPWTEADAEDTLDLIETEVSEIIADNPVSSKWKDIDYDGRSSISDVTVLGGGAYVLEKIPIAVEVY
jgi:hypothetical protein